MCPEFNNLSMYTTYICPVTQTIIAIWPGLYVHMTGNYIQTCPSIYSRVYANLCGSVNNIDLDISNLLKV